MEGLWMKVVICPLIVLIVDFSSQDVFYSSWFTAVVVGLVLALIGYFLDRVLLRPGTLWISTIIDFFVSAAIVFFSQFFIYNTFLSIAGALLISSLIAIFEYLLHRWMIQSGRATSVQTDEP